MNTWRSDFKSTLLATDTRAIDDEEVYCSGDNIGEETLWALVVQVISAGIGIR